MALKLTLVYAVRGYGLSESFYSPAGAITDGVFTSFLEYVMARRLISGFQTEFQFMRAAVDGSPRLVQLRPCSSSPNEPLLGGFRKNPEGGKISDSDVPSSTLLMRCINDVGNKYKFLYFRGYPDDQVDQGGRYIPSPQFITNFGLFVAKVKALQYGWKGVSAPGAIGQITTVAVQPSFQQLITLSADFFLDADVNKKKTVRVSGCLGCPNLNGQYTVIVKSKTTCVTKKRIPLFPYLGSGTLTVITPGVTAIDKITIERVVERKAGKQLYLSAGRRRAQRVV